MNTKPNGEYLRHQNPAMNKYLPMPTWLIGVDERIVSNRAKLIYASLAGFCQAERELSNRKKEINFCAPALSEIARSVGLCADEVYDELQQLDCLGLITIDASAPRTVYYLTCFAEMSLLESWLVAPLSNSYDNNELCCLYGRCKY